MNYDCCHFHARCMHYACLLPLSCVPYALRLLSPSCAPHALQLFVVTFMCAVCTTIAVTFVCAVCTTIAVTFMCAIFTKIVVTFMCTPALRIIATSRKHPNIWWHTKDTVTRLSQQKDQNDDCSHYYCTRTGVTANELRKKETSPLSPLYDKFHHVFINFEQTLAWGVFANTCPEITGVILSTCIRDSSYFDQILS